MCRVSDHGTASVNTRASILKKAEGNFLIELMYLNIDWSCYTIKNYLNVSFLLKTETKLTAGE